MTEIRDIHPSPSPSPSLAPAPPPRRFKVNRAGGLESAAILFGVAVLVAWISSEFQGQIVDELVERGVRRGVYAYYPAHNAGYASAYAVHAWGRALPPSVGDESRSLKRWSVETRMHSFGISRPWISREHIIVRIEPLEPDEWSPSELRELEGRVLDGVKLQNEPAAGPPVADRPRALTSVRVGAMFVDLIVVVMRAAPWVSGLIALLALRSMLTTISRASYNRAVRREDPWKCAACGYNLRGLPAGTRVCPECGERTPAWISAHPDARAIEEHDGDQRV